ncbi:hypothetical protein [Pedobacter sp. BMA]|uniref:hypothetical protein n=1 Tax=Pedobacter sp. BMA TaxID=1663685 RepID=UPI00064AA144|nr:hypothetical protein [Pedobacter sp. BMA]KLT66512.1 hypothetical protein AB669_04835 [Pedobacter sp. BMA]
MENEEKNIDQKDNQPKPTDDAQLEIETVVPSTHEKKVSEAADQAPDSSGTTQDQPKEAESAEEQETPAEDTQATEDTEPADSAKPAESAEATPDDHSDEGGNEDADDERDQIETITPSA